MEILENFRLKAGDKFTEEATPPPKKRRVLWLSDFICSTGFGQVAHNVLRELYKTGLYEFDVIAINYPGGHINPDKYPIAKDIRVYPAWPQGRTDMFGRELFLMALANRNVDLKGPWDLIFTLNDPFILEPIAKNIAELRKEAHEKMAPEWWYKWIAYWPVDAPQKQNWVERSIAQADYPVAYCQYGYEQIIKWDDPNGIYEWSQEPHSEEKTRGNSIAPSLRGRLSIIRHGTNTKDFYPLPDEEVKTFRKEFFQGKLQDDTFLIVNISRNQPRKDMARTFKVFSEFVKKVPNSYLYLHARVDDVGGNLQEIARQFDLDQSKWAYPGNFNEGRGYPISFLNKMYNAADVCLTSTLGEGWGLISTEAMACKTPIVGPNCTSFTEIFNSYNGFDPEVNRGIPVLTGATSSEWVILGQTDNERLRPLMNVDDAVSKLYWVWKNPEKVKEITERAYLWATELTWENECQKWVDLFDRAYQDLVQERNKPKEDISRNDPCPMCAEKGVPIKWKKCREHNANAT